MSCSGDASGPAAPRDTTIVSIEFFPPLDPRQTAAAYVVHDDSTLWGVSYNPESQYQRATRWAPGRPPEDLGGPGSPVGGPSTYARGVNSVGVVVGYTNASAGDWYPVRWTAAGVVDTLAGLTPFPYNGGFAYSLNEAGNVAGCGWVLTGNPQNLNATVWSPDGTLRNLGTMGGQWSCAYAISDGGFVAGEAAGQWSGGRAFRWTVAGGMEDLGTLGGPHSRAWGVNAHGEVVGEADQVLSGVPGAFRWTSAGGLQRLPPLEPGSYGAGYAINDAGDVVGYSQTRYGDHALLWRASGGFVDLSSGVPLPQAGTGHALAISPRGLIAGDEFNPVTGRIEAALWRVSVVHLGGP